MSDIPSEDHIRAWVGLVRAQQVVLRAVEADLKADGFPPLGWYDVLLELSRGPSHGLRPLDIEARLLLAQHNVSRLIDRMQKAGLLRRIACDSDGRGQIVQLTPEGVALRQVMWPAYQVAIARHFADVLDPGEAQLLSQLLGRLVPMRHRTIQEKFASQADGSIEKAG